MYCKLCGEHLYKNITFFNLFKYHYFLHEECENSIKKSSDYEVFPFLDKVVLLDYIFEKRFEESDTVFLLNKYEEILLKRAYENNDWSIVLFINKLLDKDTVILVIKLATDKILILSLFNESFL